MFHAENAYAMCPPSVCGGAPSAPSSSAPKGPIIAPAAPFVPVIQPGAGATETTGSYSTIAANLTSSIEEMPSLIASLSYLFAVLLSVQGIIKVKEHVEAPTQLPLRIGMIRIMVGSALFALPIVTEAMSGTFGDGIGPQVVDMQKVAFNVGL